MASAEAGPRSEPERARALAQVAALLAAEAAALGVEVQRHAARPDPAAQRAALLAREAAGALEMLCQGPACPHEAYMRALSALNAAAVALASAKQSFRDLHPPSGNAPAPAP